jgi:Fe-S cluster assembly iron-binding protein IscA
MIMVTEIAQKKIGQVIKENKNEEKGVRVFLYGGG